MELRFDVILYFKLGNEILIRAISDVHAGRRFPTPVLEHVSFIYQDLKELC